ncbi:MAG: SGNH/GDSL hydrolase family protein [Candidatus Dormibacteraceae bacterium]
MLFVAIAIAVLGLVLFGLDSVGLLPSTGGYRLMFVGASVTEGYYASNADHAYPADTIRDLEDRGVSVSPLVVAHAGSGTRQVLQWRLQGSPDAMVLQIATNDFGKLTLAQYEANYRKILTVLRALGPTARLLCLGAWRDPDEVNRMGQSGADFNAVTKSMCTTFNGHFVNLAAVYLNPLNHGPKGHLTAYGRADQFHPNDRGHSEIAKLVVASLGQVPT